MRPLKNFNEFSKEGVIKKQKPDLERAKNIILESEDKFKFFKKVEKNLGKSELNPNYIIETSYDILIEVIRAIILRKGYKTDSHEAEVSYIRELNFSETEVKFMNQLRYFRNGIKYYGRIFDKDYSNKVLKFLYSTHPKLKKILNDK